MNNIPIDKLDNTFGRVNLHKHIGNIILEQSTNSTPIGEIAYKDLSFTKKIKIADIGCGYGRCINYLTNIVPSGSEYIGIDPLETNKIPFLNNAKSAEFLGQYIHGNADSISNFPDKYFDLILCNYSLYFFIESLPLIVNKLKSDGLFITITHSCNCLNELLLDLQKVLKIENAITWNELGSEQILDNFNSENGFELLQNQFSDIEQIEYKNNLDFRLKDIDKLFDLLDFKKTTLIHHNDYVEYISTDEFDNDLKKIVIEKIQTDGKYILNKDDMIFRCRQPIYT